MDGEQSTIAIIVERPLFVPGLFLEMPAEQYHGIEAMSASGAKKMLRSPMHYKLMRDQPSEPTAAMQFGTAVHAGVLEPETFANVVAVLPEVNRRTTIGKAAIAEFTRLNPGRILLDAEEYARVRACIAAVWAHPGAAKLLDGGERELSLMWHDARYYVPCKARYDAFNHGGIIDLKTCQDASPEGFRKAIADFLYDVQAAFYVSAAEHVMNESPRFFCFIAVETEPPFAVKAYSIGAASILAGQHRCAIALERYAEALASGEFPGYGDTIDVIESPPWHLKFPH